jgi:probable phosphoglycerate mutase
MQLDSMRLNQVPFYYLRHGETDWNVAVRAQGHTDIPLNARGLAQAEAARDRLAGIEIGTICTSPLGRAYETARIVNQRLKRPLVVIDDLKESGFGVMEGSTQGGWFKDWRNGARFDGAETHDGFLARALSGINQALAHPGPVLVVAHGGVYWAVQRFAPLAEFRHIPNAVPIWHTPPADGAAHWAAEHLSEPV